MAENKREQQRLITALFILSLTTLIVCFSYLEFWYARRNGLQGGFHINNTSYSIFYWFSHISYLSCLFVTLWAGFEMYGLKHDKYRPKFVMRYFVLFWITLTMCGEGLLLPSMMKPRVEVILQIFNFSNWSNASWWFGINGFFYSLVDFLQFVSIHIAMPVYMIVYSAKYKQKDLTRKEVWQGLIAMATFMVAWYLLVGIATLFGMGGPYPIVDWTPDGNNDWKIGTQLFLSISGLMVFSVINFYVLDHLEKKWNSPEEEYATLPEQNMKHSN